MRRREEERERKLAALDGRHKFHLESEQKRKRDVSTCWIATDILGHPDIRAADTNAVMFHQTRVPACPRCNEHEKREMAWLEFLEWKWGTDTSLIKIRKERIERWTASRKYTKPPSD